MVKADDNGIRFTFQGFGEPERAELREEIETAIVELRQADEIHDLAALNLDQEALAELNTRSYGISTPQQLTGLEAAAVLIVLRAGTRLTDQVLADIWKGIIFPRLKKRYGSRVRPQP